MMQPRKRQYSDNGHCMVCGAFLTAKDANNTQYCNNPRHTEEFTLRFWKFVPDIGWIRKTDNPNDYRGYDFQ